MHSLFKSFLSVLVDFPFGGRCPEVEISISRSSLSGKLKFDKKKKVHTPNSKKISTPTPKPERESKSFVWNKKKLFDFIENYIQLLTLVSYANS